MNNTRADGAGHKVVGAVKEAAGKITGDKELEAKGAVEKTAGSVQHKAGKVQDAVTKP